MQLTKKHGQFHEDRGQQRCFLAFPVKETMLRQFKLKKRKNIVVYNLHKKFTNIKQFLSLMLKLK